MALLALATGINMSRFQYFLPVSSQAIMAEPMIVPKRINESQALIITTATQNDWELVHSLSCPFEAMLASFRTRLFLVSFPFFTVKVWCQEATVLVSTSCQPGVIPLCGPIPFFQCLVSRRQWQRFFRAHGLELSGEFYPSVEQF
jgi:hypothetical protein